MVQTFYADKVKPDVPILSAAEQFGADTEVEAALNDLSEALSDGHFDSASRLISVGLEADPAVAVSLLSAVGMDAPVAPDDLHAYALIVSKVIHDLTTQSSVNIGKASSSLYRLSCLQESITYDVCCTCSYLLSFQSLCVFCLTYRVEPTQPPLLCHILR